MKNKMRTNLHVFLIIAGILILSVQSAQGILIDYDATVTPDHSSLQDVFSTNKGGNTNWSASGGELTITTATLQVIWFGNHPTHDMVPWEIADNSEGNFISMQTRLATNSGEWNCYLHDGSYSARFELMEDRVTFYHSSGTVTKTIDTQAYHFYSFRLANEQVTYKIDGNLIFSGPAYASSGAKYLVIADAVGIGNTGYGSMIINHVTINTNPDPIPEPTTICLMGFGILGLLGIVIRQRCKKR